MPNGANEVLTTKSAPLIYSPCCWTVGINVQEHGTLYIVQCTVPLQCLCRPVHVCCEPMWIVYAIHEVFRFATPAALLYAP